MKHGLSAAYSYLGSWLDAYEKPPPFHLPRRWALSRHTTGGGHAIGENYDDLKGKGKEAAGKATDDPDLEREGRKDQAKADVKRGVDDAVDTVKSGVDKVTP